jgi:hypothetical protein
MGLLGQSPIGSLITGPSSPGAAASCSSSSRVVLGLQATVAFSLSQETDLSQVLPLHPKPLQQPLATIFDSLQQHDSLVSCSSAVRLFGCPRSAMLGRRMSASVPAGVHYGDKPVALSSDWIQGEAEEASSTRQLGPCRPLARNPQVPAWSQIP